jgi:hypothetical protein
MLLFVNIAVSSTGRYTLAIELTRLLRQLFLRSQLDPLGRHNLSYLWTSNGNISVCTSLCEVSGIFARF